MFVDEVILYVKGGHGGDGCVSFRREKFVPHGGPDGGDGGEGGDVIIEADKNLRTLAYFQRKRHFKAEDGEHGKGKNRNGARGADCIIKVPVGTQVFGAEGESRVVDLIRSGQRVIAARGGLGGRGNARFATPTQQVPRFAEKGEKTEYREIRLELRLLADVGLVGYPNVGKSTLLAHLSSAKPKIANYPFTTTTPNLGVVRVDDSKSFVLADIPGLIKGAHKGAGLGDRFLRHIERTRLLIHVLDITMQDVISAFHTLNEELELFNPKLARYPQVVAVNKMDIGDEGEFLKIKNILSSENLEVFPISALTGQGLSELTHHIVKKLSIIPIHEEEEEREIEYKFEPPFKILKKGERVYLIKGRKVERVVAKHNIYTKEGLKKLQKALDTLGVNRVLREMGVKKGDTVQIGEVEFEFYE